MYSYGPPLMAEREQDDQLEHTYSSHVKIRDVVQKTRRRRWMIGKSGERGSGISVRVVRHDDDDDDIYTERERGGQRKTYMELIIYILNNITLFMIVCSTNSTSSFSFPMMMSGWFFSFSSSLLILPAHLRLRWRSK